jgi:uncharacterized protein (DUF58 family)
VPARPDDPRLESIALPVRPIGEVVQELRQAAQAEDGRAPGVESPAPVEGGRWGAPWPGGWRPTPALERAVVLLGGFALLGIVLRRPDLIVLAGPFAVGTAVALATRSRRPPPAELSLDPPALMESDTLTVQVHFDPGTDGAADAVAVWLPAGWFRSHQGSRLAAACAVRPDRPVALHVELEPVRWGRAPVGPVRVLAVTAFGLLRAPVLTLPVRGVLVWPLREAFVATDQVPRAEGVVGPHRSRRPGEGIEISGVRPFQPGDRLRRINWRVTLRSGAGPGGTNLHVTTTLSDRDTDVLLCVDSRVDIGGSLDTGVRAAASIAEYYLRAGDRVGMLDLGQPGRQVRLGNGRTHLVRILDLLLDVRDRPARSETELPRILRGLPAHAMVVVLSPLLGDAAIGAVAKLTRSGRPVIAVDTLPADFAPPPRGEWTDLAWRVSRLEREADLGGLAEVGVPVVRWQGGGSLDDVLRDASLLARLPRTATR